MALYYTIKHGDDTYTHPNAVSSVSLQNGSTTASITTAGIRTLNCGGKYMNNDLVIGAKTLHCSGKIMTNNVIITTTPNTLCFTANTAGSTIAANSTIATTPNIQTSIDDGVSWLTFIPGTTTITLSNIGDKVYFKGNNPNGLSSNWNSRFRFTLTGSISASGDIMGLLDNGACTTSTIPCDYCFYELFKYGSALTTAPELSATTLKLYCYACMFSHCTSLITPPAVLPAKTITDACYLQMFASCSSLVTPPIISATNTANHCCDEMFCYCTALTYAPALSATILAARCYYQMFANCTSLIAFPAMPIASTLSDYCYYEMFRNCYKITSEPPVLSTMTLAEGCYASMFSGCKKLTSAPTLPATTLAVDCYGRMFENCTALVTAPELPATKLAENCYRYMFSNCTSLQVWTSSGSGHDKAWRIPTSGTFTNTYSQLNMFLYCPGTRSTGDDFPGAAGASYTYYTQNAPV